ncbi:MAG: dihydroxy-acid dehydratase [Desulfomicrobium escambiense]|nr:dihydroxy-acid dehydratase [Desulfomicrobium escambiense]
MDMAVGGSTNTCLHLPAIAAEAGLTLDLAEFSQAAATDAAPGPAQARRPALPAGLLQRRRGRRA